MFSITIRQEGTLHNSRVKMQSVHSVPMSRISLSRALTEGGAYQKTTLKGVGVERLSERGHLLLTIRYVLSNRPI